MYVLWGNIWFFITYFTNLSPPPLHGVKIVWKIITLFLRFRLIRSTSEPEFYKISKSAQESIPRNQFRQPIEPDGPIWQPYSYSVPIAPHRLFKNPRTAITAPSFLTSLLVFIFCVEQECYLYRCRRFTGSWARIFKRLESPGSIPLAYVAWRADATNRVVVRGLGIDSWAP